MTQQVQELIDRIKKEGIETAQGEADTIVQQAKQEADKIIQQAEAQSQQILKEAEEQSQKTKTSTTMALQQAARNTLLSLRREVQNVLQNVLSAEVGQALSADTLASMISKMAEVQKAQDVQVVCSEAQAEELKNLVVKKLQKQLKGGITIQASSDVQKGFFISFDEGKSSFDFTDESLVEFLSEYVNEYIKGILKS